MVTQGLTKELSRDSFIFQSRFNLCIDVLKKIIVENVVEIHGNVLFCKRHIKNKSLVNNNIWLKRSNLYWYWW